MQAFRAYAFDAADNSFCVLMLQSDWTRLRTEMSWSLWNCYTFSNVMASARRRLTPAAGSSCMASGCSTVKTYDASSSAVASEAIAGTQVDEQVLGVEVRTGAGNEEICKYFYCFGLSCAVVMCLMVVLVCIN